MALARALVTRPSILLLDEPLSALDPYLRVRVRRELKRLQRELGITFVHVTHAEDEAMALADLVVVMDGGRIVQQGSPESVFARPKTAFVARFVGGHSVLAGTVVEPGVMAIGAARIAVPDLAAAPGEAALIAVADAAVSIDPCETARDGNTLEGRVVSTEFRGDGTNVLVALDSGAEITARHRPATPRFPPLAAACACSGPLPKPTR